MLLNKCMFNNPPTLLNYVTLTLREKLDVDVRLSTINRTDVRFNNITPLIKSSLLNIQQRKNVTKQIGLIKQNWYISYMNKHIISMEKNPLKSYSFVEEDL